MRASVLSLIERSIDAAGADSAKEAADEAERLMADPAMDEKARELVSLQKKQSLASKLNLADARRLRDASDERRLQPLFMQNFFLNAYREAGGTVHGDEHFPVYHVGTVPSAVLDVARALRLPVRLSDHLPLFVQQMDEGSVIGRQRGGGLPVKGDGLAVVRCVTEQGELVGKSGMDGLHVGWRGIRPCRGNFQPTQLLSIQPQQSAGRLGIRRDGEGNGVGDGLGWGGRHGRVHFRHNFTTKSH